MHELVIEAERLGRQIGHLSRAGTAKEWVDEVPIRIHSSEFEGEALAFHRDFLRYLDHGVCSCGRKAVCDPNCHYDREPALGHLATCEPPCDGRARFHTSRHHNSPNRLKRALRQLRRLNPKAYDLLYLIVARGWSFEAATTKLNDDHLARGKAPLTPGEYAVLWVSGAGMLVSSF